MDGPIWMITREEEVEGYNGYYTQYTLDEEIGWFPTKEEAQAYCDQRLAAQRVEYEKYVARVAAENEVAATAHEERVKDYEALLLAGRQPTPPKPAPEPRAPRTFEQWLFNQPKYAPTEIPSGRKEG